MRIFAFIALIWATLCAPAWGQVLTAVTFEPAGQDTRVWLTFDTPVTQTPKFFSIGEGEPRFVADFKTASANLGGTPLNNGQNQIAGQGAVKGLRYAKRGAAGMRLVFDLAAGASIKEQSVTDTLINLTFTGGQAIAGQAGPQPLQVEIFEPAQAAQPQTVEPLSVTLSAPEPVFVNGIREFTGVPYPRLQPQHNLRAVRRPIIVIDPGHGGYDPGAVGAQGTLEKTLTFAGAKELQKQLIATGRYKVMLTRDNDSYVDHTERLRIARAGGADLFISIHADSAGNSSARGASVYTLSDTSKGRTREVINTQNWIMDVDLNTTSDPIGDILVDLAQRKTASQSERFADILLPRLKNSTRLVGNSHRRAGYFVLLAPDVPAVLLEMGFLSNAEDETLLNKERHREKMMKSVTAAINTYFDNQAP